jgi:probable O-glycosylation ligase (exosortase A-associated)
MRDAGVSLGSAAGPGLTVLRTAIVFAILVPGALVGLTNRLVALQIYLWFALFRPQEWVWMDISALRPSLLLALILVVPSLATGVFPYVAHPISVGSIVFLGAALLGQIDAYAPSVGWYWIDFLWRLLLISMLAITIVSDQRRFKLTLAVIAGSLGYHAAKAGFESLLGGGVRFFDGLAGAWGDNNGYAVGMSMIVPLLITVGQTNGNKWIRRGFLIAAPLTAVAVLSTFSRGGLLAVNAAAFTLAMLHKRRMVALALIFAFAVPIGVFMTSQDGYLDRMSTIRSYEQTNETSALGRLHFWRVALDMVRDHPLGVGLFNFEPAYDRYDFTNGQFGRRRSVHSSHFQVLAETGYLGAVTWISLLLYSLACAFRIRRRASHPDLTPDDANLLLMSANGLIASLAAFIVGGSFVAMALNDLTWLLFAMIASLDLISRRLCGETDRLHHPAVAEAKPLTWTPPALRRPRSAWS